MVRERDLLADHTRNELMKMAADRGYDPDPGATAEELAETIAQGGPRPPIGDRTRVAHVRERDTIKLHPGPRFKVREVGDTVVYAQRLDRSGRPRDEYREFTDRDIAAATVSSPQDTRNFWSGYEKEGGHRLM